MLGKHLERCILKFVCRKWQRNLTALYVTHGLSCAHDTPCSPSVAREALFPEPLQPCFATSQRYPRLAMTGIPSAPSQRLSHSEHAGRTQVSSSVSCFLGCWILTPGFSVVFWGRDGTQPSLSRVRMLRTATRWWSLLLRVRKLQGDGCFSASNSALCEGKALLDTDGFYSETSDQKYYLAPMVFLVQTAED